VRRAWPERLPLWVRISTTDWAEGGWTADDSVRLASTLAPLGADLIDCSSGGLIPEPRQADDIIRAGQADLVLLARELLRRPNWPLHAAKDLGQPAPVPPQYARAF